MSNDNFALKVQKYCDKLLKKSYEMKLRTILKIPLHQFKQKKENNEIPKNTSFEEFMEQYDPAFFKALELRKMLYVLQEVQDENYF